MTNFCERNFVFLMNISTNYEILPLQFQSSFSAKLLKVFKPQKVSAQNVLLFTLRCYYMYPGTTYIAGGKNSTIFTVKVSNTTQYTKWILRICNLFVCDFNLAVWQYFVCLPN